MGRTCLKPALASMGLALLTSLCGLTPLALAREQEVKVAVAANFTDPMKEIAQAFMNAGGDKVLLSFGATGQFYAQITQGAPFDILISADKATPARAIAEGHGVAGTSFTYAIGRLALFSKTPGTVRGEETLRNGKFAKIAVANPATAPYGAAGIEVMKALGVFDALQPKIVQGQNIAQTFQFVDTGNAEVGFVALSQITLSKDGSRWVVPSNLHAPIAQDAVLLKPGEKSEAARALLAFLKGAEAKSVIEKFGYAPGE